MLSKDMIEGCVDFFRMHVSLYSENDAFAIMVWRFTISPQYTWRQINAKMTNAIQNVKYEQA